MSIYTHDDIWAYDGVCNDDGGYANQKPDDLLSRKKSGAKHNNNDTVINKLLKIANEDNQKDRQKDRAELVATSAKKTAKGSFRKILTSLFSRNESKKR